MKKKIFILFLFLPVICFAQKVTYGDNSVRIEGKTFLYFDAEGNPITDQAHRDSLETHKYVISIKGTDEIPEIHLVYKHPKLETLIGETLPKVDLSDISGKSVDFDESEYTVICFWNRHCSICIRELIVLNILAEDYPNVQFVGLTPDSPEEVQKLMKKLNLEWEDIRIVPNYKWEFTDIL